MILSKIVHIQYLVALVGLLVPFFVFGQVSSFTVGQQIGNDTIAPTIPAPIAVIPVSSSQIDITWGASTDDQNLSGYRVFRDAVHIATTSLTTYSDTGLSASTTYSYTVEAYDWFINISTTSVSVATTTLQAPVVPTASSTRSTSGTRLHLRLFDLVINTQETSVEIEWETNQYAQYSLRWGKESSYDLGFVQNDLFKKIHKTGISDLEPGTTYMYELIAYNQHGEEFVLSRDTFTTKTTQDITPPLNVSGLYAVLEGDSVRLLWDNPLDTDFSKVRIVRNNIFYPRDPSNGYIAYNGRNESFLDEGALRSYDIQYYTLFSYDESGNISSGAIIAVYKRGNDFQYSGDVPHYSGEEDSQVEVPVGVLYKYKDLDFLDVQVLQNDKIIDPFQGSVTVSSDLPVVVQIPYDLLPEHLKTILVTIDGKDIHVVSYMLRVNKDKSSYRAVMPPLTHLGEYTLSFSIYDYQTQLLSSFGGELLSAEFSTVKQFTEHVFNDGINRYVFSFLFLILAIFFYIILLRKRSGR